MVMVKLSRPTATFICLLHSDEDAGLAVFYVKQRTAFGVACVLQKLLDIDLIVVEECLRVTWDKLSGRPRQAERDPDVHLVVPAFLDVYNHRAAGERPDWLKPTHRRWLRRARLS